MPGMLVGEWALKSVIGEFGFLLMDSSSLRLIYGGVACNRGVNRRKMGPPLHGLPALRSPSQTLALLLQEGGRHETYSDKERDRTGRDLFSANWTTSIRYRISYRRGHLVTERT